MQLETWAAYALAFAVVSLIPGPSVLLVISQAMSRGRRAAMGCIAGDLAGGVCLMSASYLGLGLLLASSALAFTALKWAGVGYMAYLGLSQIWAARSVTELDLGAIPASRGSLRIGFVTGVLNPKAIMFHMAFLAQFIDPAAPQLPQFLILMATTLVVVGAVLGAYALLAATISGRLRGARAQRRLGYAGGTALLGGSALMAVTR